MDEYARARKASQVITIPLNLRGSSRVQVRCSVRLRACNCACTKGTSGLEVRAARAAGFLTGMVCNCDTPNAIFAETRCTVYLNIIERVWQERPCLASPGRHDTPATSLPILHPSFHPGLQTPAFRLCFRPSGSCRCFRCPSFCGGRGWLPLLPVCR